MEGSFGRAGADAQPCQQGGSANGLRSGFTPIPEARIPARNRERPWMQTTACQKRFIGSGAFARARRSLSGQSMSSRTEHKLTGNRDKEMCCSRLIRRFGDHEQELDVQCKAFT